MMCKQCNDSSISPAGRDRDGYIHCICMQYAVCVRVLYGKSALQQYFARKPIKSISCRASRLYTYWASYLLHTGLLGV